MDACAAPNDGGAKTKTKTKTESETERGHCGLAWAYTRAAIDTLGGLFAVSYLGAGDNVMSLAYIGQADRAIPRKAHKAYAEAVLAWQEKAAALGGRLGFVKGSVAHHFHGPTANRNYMKRVRILEDHAFDPNRDLKSNPHGVLEFAGNKPRFEAAVHAYFTLRSEDDIRTA